MKYFTLLMAITLTGTSFGCPPGHCHDKKCPQAKVHTTGVGGGATQADVHDHMHGHDAEHEAQSAKFRLKPEGTAREVKTTPKAATKVKKG